MAMSLPNSQARAGLDDLQWKALIRRIEGGTVIPIVGEGLSNLPKEVLGAETSLGAYLAGRIAAQKPDLPGSGSAPSTLNELACRWLAGDRNSFEDLYIEIVDCLNDLRTCALPSPLLKLAEIRSFSLFVSTTFDPFLQFALGENRFGARDSDGLRVYSYDGTSSVDIPVSLAKLDYPVVYHLFGKAQAGATFAVSDEDVLECMHTLGAEERQPRNLFDALHRSQLLVLGCGLSGWLARFFLRMSYADRMRKETGARYLIEAGHAKDGAQVLFFEHFGGTKVLDVPAVEFVDELHRRWLARGVSSQPPSRPEKKAAKKPTNDVFLSYASEDLEAVKRLRERLVRDGKLRVWFDKNNLRGGDKWSEVIRDALKDCAVFVPLISANVKNGTYRFVRDEWQAALEHARGFRSDLKYVMPGVLDGTDQEDPSIDKKIRDLQWRPCLTETDAENFVKEIREAVAKANAE